MASFLPRPVEKVIEQFEKLPGVGPKSAARMVYHYLRARNGEARALAEALIEMENQVVDCVKCFNVSLTQECQICGSKLRDRKKLCIVEEPLDVVAFESSGIFKGVYFVLGGVISPADGISPEELRFKELKKRVTELMNSKESEELLEIIIAVNPSLEGEATSEYIYSLLKQAVQDGGVKLTRLAVGLPTGADLEYADRVTLKRALEGRTPF